MTKLKNLETLYRKRAITRRDFMEGALALGVSVTTATQLMSQAEAATPKKGGTFRLGLVDPATSDTLDPATYISNHTQIGMNFGVLNNLTEVATNGELIPELAESFDASDDAATWTFKLRKGVEFHNGKSFEAEDVIASVNHHRGEDSKSAAKPLLAELADVRADDKHTVVFELSGGNADFPFIMNDYHIPIMPAKDGKLDWQDGTGTGGYILTGFDPGVRMTMKRNPNSLLSG